MIFLPCIPVSFFCLVLGLLYFSLSVYIIIFVWLYISLRLLVYISIYSIWLMWALYWVHCCQIRSLKSLLPAVPHDTYIHLHTYIIYHCSYNRLSERLQWFTMNGFLFILFGFFHQPVCRPFDVSPLAEFNAASPISLITATHYATRCIYVPHTCTLYHSPVTGYLGVFLVQHEWPSFYTLWFLPSLVY